MDSRVGRRAVRFVPAAVTPIGFNDLSSALFRHMKNEGRHQFEQEMSSYLGVKKVYTYSSFMRAIFACLSSLRKSDVSKNEVIISRYSCPTFIHAIYASGLKVKYCDVDPTTLSIKKKDLCKMNMRNVLAVVCVNHFGLANPMDVISDICRDNDTYLVEDLGYAIGTEYQNSRLGTFGDFSVLNFQEGKAIPIGGGMVTTNIDGIIADVSNYKNGWTDILTMFGYKFLSDPRSYFIFMKISEKLNYNFRKKFSMEDTIRCTTEEYDFKFDPNSHLKSLSNFQGALGCSLLSKLDKYIEVRGENAKAFESELSTCNNISLIKKERGVNKIHYIRYPILLKGDMRNEVLKELLKNGIEASTMYSEHGLNIDGLKFPGSKKISDEILTLPCNPRVNEEDIEIIVNILKRVG